MLLMICVFWTIFRVIMVIEKYVFFKAIISMLNLIICFNVVFFFTFFLCVLGFFFFNTFLGSEKKLYVIRVFKNKNQFEGFRYFFFWKINFYLLKWCHIPLNISSNNIIHNDRKYIGNKLLWKCIKIEEIGILEVENRWPIFRARWPILDSVFFLLVL
jgi:hypothetical protein